MMILSKRCYAAVILIFLSTLASAQYYPVHKRPCYQPCIPCCDDTWFIGIGGGGDWINYKSSTQVPNGSRVRPHYNNDQFSVQSPKTAALAQIYVGYRIHDDCDLFPYYNVYFQYRHNFNSLIKGHVNQYSIADMRNYKYHININSDLFTINGKFNIYECNCFLPYISVGLGIISNHVGNYHENALKHVTPRISPSYKTKTNSNAAGTLGVGVDFILLPTVWVTLGYEHLFQGKIRSGDGRNTWTNTALHFGYSNMNTVFMNMTIDFPEGFRRC